jgi:hypothetical protein
MAEEKIFKLEELDDLLDEPETVIGHLADWHGEIVPIVAYRGGFALKVVLKCNRKGCRHQMTVRAVSGCHSGAYCYVYDRHGNFADLRNQNFVCDQHRKPVATYNIWDDDRIPDRVAMAVAKRRD